MMIVLTGAAGFIGSCILAKLNERGREDIYVVDHLETGNPHVDLKKQNLNNKKYKSYFEKKDFLELVLKNKLLEDIDLCIHMGACSSTTLQDAQYFQKNNFEYSCHLALWALKRGARFIYASSAATYGDGSQGYDDNHALIRRCRPLNLYGESKQRFDEWIADQNLLDRVVGLKFFNVFGPNEYHKGDMRSVVAKAYPQVRDDGKMSLFKSYKKEFADGEQKRDFVYIKDVLDIVCFFVDHPDICGIYNVGTGTARSWNDLAHAIFKALGKRPHIEYIEMPKNIQQRYQYFTQANMSKLRRQGYTRPFRSLEESVEDYLKYLSRQTYI